MSGQSCQCDECQVSRRQEPATHFADDATLARIAELERENAELRKDAERWKLASTDHRFGIANWCEFGMKVSYANHAEEIVDAAIASEKENRDVKTAL